jgi:hypothetical protein
MVRRFQDKAYVADAQSVITWARDAQDNELWHLLAVTEKMKADGIKDAWYLTPPIPALVMGAYWIFARLLATVSIKRAFLFNAEFEDHAEHNYAHFVADHPEWDAQLVGSALVAAQGEFDSWGDVFRRVGLDERDHMNHSFRLAGKPEHVVAYAGMPQA